MSVSRDQILSMFRETGALLEGHFQLTSGLHSPQYFQCAKVLQHPRSAEVLCSVIAEQFRNRPVDAVIAPALGGIVVGQEVGRLLAQGVGGRRVRTMFAERKDGVMQLRRGFALKPGEHILVCEDVVTTGGSVHEVIELVRTAGALVEGVACIVDRSGGRVKFDTRLQVAVVVMDVVTYSPGECPLCHKGIPVEQPGSRGIQ